jgi:hypothetical protein
MTEMSGGVWRSMVGRKREVCDYRLGQGKRGGARRACRVVVHLRRTFSSVA